MSTGPKSLGEILASGWVPDGNGGFCRPKREASVVPTVGVEKESDLHEQIFSECRKRGWIAFHGSMAERTHRTGGEMDFHILCNAGRTLLVEAKSRNGKLSPDQQAIKHWAAKLGHTIHVVRSFEEFLQLADEQKQE